MNVTKITIGTAVLLSVLTLGLIVPERQARHALELQLAAVTRDRDSLRQQVNAIEAESARLRADAAAKSPRGAPSLTRATEPASPGVKAPALAADLAEAMNARRAKMHSRYDPFFRQRGLTPEQAERFVDLEIESENLRTDLQAAVRDQGLTADDQIEALRDKLTRPIKEGFSELLGDDGMAAFRQFESYSYYRPVYVDPLVEEFSAGQLPLTDPQIDRLVAIVARNDRPVKMAPSDLGSQSQIDWDTVTEQAGELLTPAQLSLLKYRVLILQQRQQAKLAKRSGG